MGVSEDKQAIPGSNCYFKSVHSGLFLGACHFYPKIGGHWRALKPHSMSETEGPSLNKEMFGVDVPPSSQAQEVFRLSGSGPSGPSCKRQMRQTMAWCAEHSHREPTVPWFRVWHHVNVWARVGWALGGVPGHGVLMN